ncbi:mechanosensitive ion channel, partial [Citrobacter sp. AAK_AS5]
SNLISGLFLVMERPFVVGDVITVDDVTGEVLTIDMLSTKLRTFDNLYVRMPNETIIKSRVTNLTHFPIRRIDLRLGVAYREDLARVRAVLDA